MRILILTGLLLTPLLVATQSAPCQQTTPPASTTQTAPPTPGAVPPAPGATNITTVDDGYFQISMGALKRYKVAAETLDESALGRILSRIELSKSRATSAAQVTQLSSEGMVDLLAFQAMQNQRLIEQNELLTRQNAEMIALLKQIAAKK